MFYLKKQKKKATSMKVRWINLKSFIKRNFWPTIQWSSLLVFAFLYGLLMAEFKFWFYSQGRMVIAFVKSYIPMGPGNYRFLGINWIPFMMLLSTILFPFLPKFVPKIVRFVVRRFIWLTYYIGLKHFEYEVFVKLVVFFVIWFTIYCYAKCYRIYLRLLWWKQGKIEKEVREAWKAQIKKWDDDAYEKRKAKRAKKPKRRPGPPTTKTLLWWFFCWILWYVMQAYVLYVLIKFFLFT